MSTMQEIARLALWAAYRELSEIQEQQSALLFRKVRLQRAIDALSKMPECADAVRQRNLEP